MKQQIRVGIMRTTHSTASLQQKMADKRAMRLLCSEAVDQQVKRGEATSGQLRNRRRYLVKQVLKRVPLSAQRSPRKLLHVASMVLAMWGFVGLSVPQVAEATPIFQHNMLDGFDVGSNATPTFADIDGDGDLDAFVGNNLGIVKFYRNNARNLAPVFAADIVGNPLAGFAVGSYATPTFADIDGDGDLDAFVGEKLGTVKFFKNLDPSPTAVADTLNALVNTASTTGDVTRNDVFKLGSSVVTFPIIAFDSASVQGGIVTYNGNNTFTYLPAVGFSGTDSFTYTLSDGAGNSAVGTVNVTVTGTVTVPPFASGTTTGGGVGCVISPSQSFDPLLPLLIIAGLFMPWIRRNMLKSMETDTNTTT